MARQTHLSHCGLTSSRKVGGQPGHAEHVGNAGQLDNSGQAENGGLKTLVSLAGNERSTAWCFVPASFFCCLADRQGLVAGSPVSVDFHGKDGLESPVWVSRSSQAGGPQLGTPSRQDSVFPRVDAANRGILSVQGARADASGRWFGQYATDCRAPRSSRCIAAAQVRADFILDQPQTQGLGSTFGGLSEISPC